MSQPVIETMKQRIETALAPTQLDIIDDSEEHLGHASAPAGAGHYTVVIASPQFADKTPVACHRLVYAAVGDLMPTKIHALRIQVIE